MTRLALNTVIVLAVLTGVYVVWQLRAAAVLFVLSLAVAASLRPLIEWLARRGLPRMAALLIAYSLVFGAMGAFGFYASGPLVAQAQRLGDDFVAAYQAVYEQGRIAGGEKRTFAPRLPPPDDFLAAMSGEQGAALLQTAVGATFTLFAMAVDFVIVLFLGVYWSIDQVHFERLWLSMLPVERRGYTRELWWAIERETGAYVRSETVQSIAAGVLLWLGYLALGQRYPLLLALVGAVAWLVPWIGVLLAVAAVAVASLPAILLNPAMGLASLVPAIVYTSAVLLVLQLFIEPRFFDRRRYNALITAVIIFGMADLAGLMGLVLGAPLAAALQIAGRQWVRLRLANGAESQVVPGSFAERLVEVQTALSRRKRPAPELANLIDRLATIVEEADGVLETRSTAVGS
jgi:putative permease